MSKKSLMETIDYGPDVATLRRRLEEAIAQRDEALAAETRAQDERADALAEVERLREELVATVQIERVTAFVQPLVREWRSTARRLGLGTIGLGTARHRAAAIRECADQLVICVSQVLTSPPAALLCPVKARHAMTTATIENDRTGETAPAHRIGTDEDGTVLYAHVDGWSPVGPFVQHDGDTWSVDVEAVERIAAARAKGAAHESMTLAVQAGECPCAVCAAHGIETVATAVEFSVIDGAEWGWPGELVRSAPWQPVCRECAAVAAGYESAVERVERTSPQIGGGW